LSLAQKYGVVTVAELDQLVQSGQVHAPESFEDYFEFDYLEAKKEALLEALNSLLAYESKIKPRSAND
jgi:hypothetical protein